MEKLNTLVDLAKKATSGEWIADSGEGWNAIISQKDMVNNNFIIGEFIGPDSTVNKDFVLAASPENILAIAEAFRALEQRAEAAEAKLAEQERQKPVAWQCNAHGLMQTEDKEQAARWIKKGWKVWALFTRPAPAINPAELVPVEGFLEDSSDGSMLTWQRGWNACRAAILRNIEESGLSKPAAPEVE